MRQQEFAELKRLNSAALPFNLHRDEFQTSTTTSPGLSTDDEDFDDEQDDQVTCDLASPTTPHPTDAIPDLIPNQHNSADEGSSGLSDSDHFPSNQCSDDRGRSSSPHDIQKSRSLSVLIFVGLSMMMEV